MKLTKLLLIPVVLCFLTELSTSCSLLKRGTDGSNTGNSNTSAGSSSPAEVSQAPPIEQSPDPIPFESIDLRDAVREFKKLLGERISVTKIVLEKDAMTVAVYKANDTGSFRFTSNGVTKVSGADSVAELRFIHALSNVSPIQYFDLDNAPLSMVPRIVSIAPKIVWIEGGKVEKIEIGNASSWTVTIGGTQNQIVHRLSVTGKSFGVYEDNYLRNYTGYLTDPSALKEKMASIKDYIGGKLDVLSLEISAGLVALKARDPRKPNEFNELSFNEKGKWTDRPVSESSLRIRPGDPSNDPHVRSIEDKVFNVDDLDLNLVSQMADEALNKLRLEKSSVSSVDIVGKSNKDLKWRVNVNADKGRSYGHAIFNLKGHLLESKQD